MTCICRYCGNEWRPRIDNPKMCPACKRIHWQVAESERVFIYCNDTKSDECLARLRDELGER